jgi:hypothetical protein
MGGSAANRVTSGNSGITGTTLGAAGGSELLHTHSHTGTTNAGGAHNHTATVTDPTHTHGVVHDAIGTSGAIAISGGSAAPYTGANIFIQGAVTGITVANTAVTDHTHGFTTASAGTGSSQNMPPAMMVNFIVKA